MSSKDTPAGNLVFTFVVLMTVTLGVALVADDRNPGDNLFPIIMGVGLIVAVLASCIVWAGTNRRPPH
jgi:hypothetical protein